MKQTAVEWLLEQIFKHNNLVKGDGWFYVKPDIIEQAKEMHKQELIDAVGVGSQFDRNYLYGYHDKAEEYYQETYGGKNE